MKTIKFIYQPLILTVAEETPTIPSPADLTPDDIAWDFSTNLLVGQEAFNVVDEKWYYRSELLGIVQSNNGQINNTLTGLDDVTSVPTNGAILEFNSTSGFWEEITTLDADTLEGKTAQDIEDEVLVGLQEPNVIENIVDAPSTPGWYGISRWKTKEGEINSSLLVKQVGGLVTHIMDFKGIAAPTDITNWNLKVSSNNGSYFTLARLSQYTVGGDDYTYLEVYKDITNVGTFTIVTRADDIHTTDVDYTYESLSFVDVSSLSLLLRSNEITTDSNLLNINEDLILSEDKLYLKAGIQLGDSAPIKTEYKIPIGAWDMDTTDEVSVGLPAGITHEQVVSISIMIDNDLETERSPLDIDGYLYVDNTDTINIIRSTNGYYDSNDFTVLASRGTIYLTTEKIS